MGKTHQTTTIDAPLDKVWARIRNFHDMSWPSNVIEECKAVDAETFEVKKYLLAGQRVWQLAFSPDEGKLFTTNGISNDVSVIDVKRLKVVKSITVGRFPWGVVVK